MKEGTWSVLMGCHSPFHCTLVLISWVKLYKSLPKPWELVCIYLHDIGHWGKDYLSHFELKERHWELGAKIARRLFGQKGYDLIAGHCGYNDVPKSRLYKPDKYSWYIAPTWWLLSNQIFEPRLKMGYTRIGAVRHFQARVKESIESGDYRSTHAIYLERAKLNT